MVTVSTPAATAATSSTCPVQGAPCATNGQLACNGASYGQCVNGAWVVRACGNGSVCVPDGSSLYCGAPGTAPDTTCSA
jgi:chitinase